MVDYNTTMKVGAVQAEPVWLDAAATVEKSRELIAQAANDGVELLAFAETWIPGYPFWIWLDAPAAGMPLVGRYHANSMTRDDEHMRALQDAARTHNISLVVGLSERNAGTLHMSQALINADGELVRLRRKLRPTHVERTIFGDGDGSDLAVVDMAGARVGALCCWEHLQPLVRMAMYGQHEQVHVASWPSFGLYRGMAFALGPEVNMAASRMYAAEGQCFVIAATQVVGEAAYEVFGDDERTRSFLQPGGGYSMIFGPDGRELAEGLDETAEGIVTADIDLAMIPLAKNAGDPVGHYGRPDILRMFVSSEPRSVVTIGEQRHDAAGESHHVASVPEVSLLPEIGNGIAEARS
ncbi:carbon-nitrogen hydrolase family protein [Nitriliruptor alkaliphilus]|uniref:carbon-nitrogen hydrolase family protein n=1 Tax=Nitriliruptor alkaliphilus TaxID=427918 RepID=UPI0009FB016D|nr:carbon-nitrogen hydrolase family protein [Nitriliruptor alkaliphilus]